MYLNMLNKNDNNKCITQPFSLLPFIHMPPPNNTKQRNFVL